MQRALLPLALLPAAALAQERPNIVCIVSEDNTKDYMSLFMGDKGTQTPNIEWMSSEGMLFTNAYSNGPVSSAARSALISGCYGPRLGSHYHRGEVMVNMPKGTLPFPAYLRNAGYYTANNAKEDYNVVVGKGVWDDSSRKATWRNRAEGQPFYYVHNLADTHEGQMLKTHEQMAKEIEGYTPSCGVDIQPNYPDTQLFKDAYSFYCKRIEQMDKKVGAIIEKLRSEGLLENTIILYYGDNGGIMPNSKGYLTEMGINVPLVIRLPEKLRKEYGVEPRSRDGRFVSFTDLGATILDMAGVEIPQHIDGRSLWDIDPKSEQVVYGYADRMGEKYDMVRSIRIGNYKYVRAFQPFNFDALSNSYRRALPTYEQLHQLHEAGKLNPTQELFFKAKAPEMLYDLSNDPYELKNLATESSMQKVLTTMRRRMSDWQLEINDVGLLPEYYWVREAGADVADYAQQNSKRIASYLDIANLQITTFTKAKSRLSKALSSEDEVARQWAVVVCSSFGKEAESMLPIINRIAKEDRVAANRARAAEYLLLNGYDNSSATKQMLEALYSTADPREAAQILNSMTMLSEGETKIVFTIDRSRVKEAIVNYPIVKSALAKHK